MNKNLFFVVMCSLLAICTAEGKVSKMVVSKKDFVTNVTGVFKKYDNDYVYLSVKQARKPVIVPRKYLLNHPAKYPQDMVVSVDLPLSVYVSHNLKDLKSAKK